MGEEMHQIGEVAAAVGLSLRTIRHYEEVDLVPPSGRTAGGFRLYTDADIERLQLVKDLKPLDFTLEEMRQVLTIRHRLSGPDAGAEERRRLRGQLEGFASVADERCQQLREQVKAAEMISALLRKEASTRRRRARLT